MDAPRGDTDLGTHTELATIGMDASELRDKSIAAWKHYAEECDRLETSGQRCHTEKDQAYLEELARTAMWVGVVADGKYDAVNVKLDKTGGLTEALTLVSEARAMGFLVMVGCMLGTSLGMAPAVILAQDAHVVDLDGPLLLAGDRTPGLAYDDALVAPPEAALWG